MWLLLLLLLPLAAIARPVSYPGGWTLMTENNADRYSAFIHYSPTARYSIGYRGEYWRKDSYWLQSIGMNNLLKRWNAPEWQANIYLKSGLGIAHSDQGEFDNEIDPLAYSGLAADWEDRRFFAGYEFRAIYADQINKSFHQRARIGITPYIGEYGDVHTWLMLEVSHHPGSPDLFVITPLIRFFKDVYLLEIGVSDKNDLMVNGIIRF